MEFYRIEKYSTNHYEDWNDFVTNSKNGTFLFHRDYMEYHHDRFEDFSLMIFKKEVLIGLLPAHKVGDEVFSHWGLTYGSFVFSEKIKLSDSIRIMKLVLQFLKKQTFNKLYLKLIPSIYHRYFSEEIEYSLFLTKAQLLRRDCLSVLDLTKPFQFSKKRKESIRRGEKNNLEIIEEPNFKLFWNDILIPNLHRKHQSKPVHSLEEMEYLHSKFSENIRQFNVYHHGKIVAGTTMYITENVAHPQYISADEQRSELGSIDLLYHTLITEIFADKQYFDFGPSHENQGKQINEGILFWKESYDAKTTVQDYYVVETKNYVFLENVLI